MFECEFKLKLSLRANSAGVLKIGLLALLALKGLLMFVGG